MINRKAYETAILHASQFPVIAITCPRQSGKTTLARMSFPDVVIIAKAQKVPDIFDSVKLVVDSGFYSPGKFILTGSSQFKSKSNISDSLAGRVGIVNLLPFTVEELNDALLLPSDSYDVFKGFYLGDVSINTDDVQYVSWKDWGKEESLQ